MNLYYSFKIMKSLLIKTRFLLRNRILQVQRILYLQDVLSHHIKKVDKYMDLARELKKLWNMKVIVITIVVSVPGTFLKDLEKRLGGTRNWRKNWDHSIVKISLNT